MLKSKAIRVLAQGVLAMALCLPALSAQAHAERTAYFPQDRITTMTHPARVLDAQGRPLYRPLLPTPQAQRLVVCKRPDGDGVAAGEDSESRIARIGIAALKKVNEKLYKECGFQHLQDAVDAVKLRGTTIYVLPGVYREQSSVQKLERQFGAHRAEDRDFCQAVLQRGPGKLSYEEQFKCPFIQNTVAIFGDPDFTDDNAVGCGDGTSNGVCLHPETQRCDTSKSACQYYDLQIEGTGEKITDVIFEGDFVTKSGDPADGHFRYLNGIRADRADGIYLRNFTTQIFEFNAVYVMETDGYVFDHLLSRWVDEYAFLSFASDHGLYDYTEGYSAADSVQYPGSGADIYPNANHASADLRKRQATEVRNSKGHHSALGYSGTAGNAPWVHDNEFYKNQTGMATESVYGGHPGMPQDHALWENNKVYSNNKDYYQLVSRGGPCIDKKPRDRGVVPDEFRYFDTLPADYQEAIMDRTVVCPPIPFPTGTAMIIAGGNYDVLQKNQVFDNWRQGLWLLSIPTLIHNLTEGPETPLTPVLGQDPTGTGGTVDDVIGGIPADDAESVKDPFFTAHFNRVLENHFGESSSGQSQPNGVDIWWDNSGVGNCFVGNTSKQGAVTSDLGPLGVLGLPTDCKDGNNPDLINQVTTVRPDRLVPFVNCLEYNRNDPDSKGDCPFFQPIHAPAGREGSAQVTAQRPTQGQLVAGTPVSSGYFVLHNATGDSHRLKAATLRASGPLAELGALTLAVKDIYGVTRSATGTVSGDTIRFSFDDAPAIPAGHAVVFDLQAQPRQLAMKSGLMLASLGSGVLLLVGGLRRRERGWLLAAAVAISLLSACGGRSSDASDSGGQRSGSGKSVQFQLTELEFAEGAGTTYSGLPLTIGSARLP